MDPVEGGVVGLERVLTPQEESQEGQVFGDEGGPVVFADIGRQICAAHASPKEVLDGKDLGNGVVGDVDGGGAEGGDVEEGGVGQVIGLGGHS